ncbi:MAG TPA: hypothetical protein P5567_00480 [Kiritimatiellia bacterium]|nr:hypothetical protein [Kiritimatiellia bacterium]HRZ10910.1 hypothetical protein [Kiritimatiellia bacterium]HSA18817.1 hypothetical protein [Kiritimatiellia bacterium]
MKGRGLLVVLLAALLGGPEARAQTNEPAAGRALVEATRKAKVRLWGQVNRALLYAENGSFSEWFHVDNDSSPSRLGAAGEYTPDGWPDWTFGGQVELGFKSDNSAAVTFGGEDPEFEVDGRKIEAYARSPSAGSLALGQGDMASNGSAEEDLSGTYVISYSQVRFAAASLVFGTNGPAIKEVFNNFDGLHRDDRLRYDTPAWHGWSAAASAAGQDFYDAALRFARDLGPCQGAAALAVAHKGADVDQFSGSCSVWLDGGLNVTAAAGGQEVEGDYSPFSWYGKIGWRLDWLSCGETCLAVDYSRNEEISQAGDRAESRAVVLNQRLEPIASDLYASVRTFTLDRPGEEYEDVLTVMAGVRLCF